MPTLYGTMANSSVGPRLTVAGMGSAFSVDIAGTGNSTVTGPATDDGQIDYYDRDRRIALGVVSAFLVTIMLLSGLAVVYYYVLRRRRRRKGKDRHDNEYPRRRFSIPYGKKPKLPPKPAKKKATTPFKTASRPAHTIHYSLVPPKTKKHVLNTKSETDSATGTKDTSSPVPHTQPHQHEQLTKGVTKSYQSTSLRRVTAVTHESSGSSSYYEPLSTGPGTRSNSMDDLLDGPHRRSTESRPKTSDDVFSDAPSRSSPPKPRRETAGEDAARNEMCLASELLLTMQEEQEMKAVASDNSPKGQSPGTFPPPLTKRPTGLSAMLPMGLDYDEDALLETLRNQQKEGAGYVTDEELIESSVHGTIQLIVRFDTSRVFHVMVKCLNDLQNIGGGEAALPNAFVKIRLLPDRSAKCKTRVIKRCNNPIYNEEFLFAGYSMTFLQRAKLQIQVFHYDLLSKRQLIGELSISLRHLNLPKGVTLWRGLNEPRREERAA
ncbi:uncharacterized protein LOC135826427 [Sycon ciliatum]|uniref:uncharacterized protein LOC135826427 n=1 Tax=Sycon ciliatum TaxID=27933 RepID=UPI0020AA4C11|eukprot:scpid45985/ scgid5958/ Synaptotagmin-7; Synaptotagmin VII